MVSELLESSHPHGSVCYISILLRAHDPSPGQSSSIYIASVSLTSSPDSDIPPKLNVTHIHHIAGHPRTIAAIDPKWLTPTSGIFLSDEGGWSNPFIFEIDTSHPEAPPVVERALQQIIPEEFGGSQYWLSSSFSAHLGYKKVAFMSYRRGSTILSIIDFSRPLEERKRMELLMSYSNIQYMHGNGECVVFLSQFPTSEEELTELRLDSVGEPIQTSLLPPQTRHPDLRSEYISSPEYFCLTLPAVPDTKLPRRNCHVTYYPPKNPHYSGGKPDEKPPVIVTVHGGPTYTEWSSLDWKKQFWTSRGWAQSVQYSRSRSIYC